jgi:hypothetical protein
VAARVRQRLGIEMPLRPLFEGATLAEIAAGLDADGAHPLQAAAERVIFAADRTAPLPLSYQQERLWFIDRMDPGNPAYNMSTALRLRGALDEDALDRALGEIVRRHEALRTTFGEVDGAPVQVIHPAEGWRMVRQDLSAGDAAEAELDRRIHAERLRGFDLAAGPLFRATLLCLAADDHALVMVVHHAVSDGWSSGLVQHELSALYTAFAADQASPLAPPAVQYADYAAWQRATVSGDALEAQVEWWRQALEGAPEVLELPTDRPRPALQGFAGARCSLPLPAAARLAQVARAEAATPFMALLAAFNAVLAAYSGARDVVVGSPVAGRLRRELEDLAGFFVNTLAVRTDLSGDPCFRALLGRVRRAALDAFAHTDVPFERVVEAVRPQRSMSYSPLFQVAFAMHDTGESLPSLPGLRVSAAGGARAVAKFDLTLTIVERAGAYTAVLDYATDLFDAATAERMLAHYAQLLERAAADPDAPLSRLPLAGDAELARVTAEWNATAREYPRQAGIAGLFAGVAAAHAELPAVRWGDDSLSYAELDARADRLARRTCRWTRRIRPIGWPSWWRMRASRTCCCSRTWPPRSRTRGSRSSRWTGWTRPPMRCSRPRPARTGWRT